MPTTPETPEEELLQEILEIADTLRFHVSRLATSSDQIKVRISQGVVRKVAYIDIDQQYRITRYGLVPRQSGIVTPVGDEQLRQRSVMELIDIRRALLELAHSS